MTDNLWLFEIDPGEANYILESDRTDMTKDELMIIYFIREQQTDILHHIRFYMMNGLSIEKSILRGICEAMDEKK